MNIRIVRKKFIDSTLPATLAQKVGRVKKVGPDLMHLPASCEGREQKQRIKGY